MIIRASRSRDSDQIFELFRKSSISRNGSRRTKRGFFEYPLRYEDIADRVNMPFSIVWENSRGRIVGYVLAYQIKDVPALIDGYRDPVHETLARFDPDVVYVDQLCINPHYPVTLASRLEDTFEYRTRMERVPGVVGAIPESPWKNQSSTRLALARGFSRAGTVRTGECTLRLFAKPYLPVGAYFEGLGDRLLASH